VPSRKNLAKLAARLASCLDFCACLLSDRGRMGGLGPSYAYAHPLYASLGVPLPRKRVFLSTHLHMKRIRSIFVATTAPPADSPYYELARTWKVEIVFANLIEIQGYTLPEFREQGLSPLDFQGFIFSSKQAVDHFFRLMAEMRLELPPESRFLCTGEIVGQQVYQYVQGGMRRRIYSQANSLLGLIPYMRKYPDLKYLYVGGGAAPLQFFEEAQRYKLNLSTVKVYHVHYITLPPALKRRRFSVLCFPTPTSVMGWFHNHPKFQQKDTLVLVYGEDTQRIAESYGIKIHDYAPRPEAPSLLALLRNLLRTQG